MSLVYGDIKDSLRNRKNFLVSLGIDYQNLICAKQVHGSRIEYVQEIDRGRGALSYDAAIAGIDAFITDKRNVPLAVFTADCLSIFLYDPNTPGIGLVHGGWRSTKQNIATKTLRLMQGKFNSKPKDLYVGFGPAIRDCCYEVGKDFSADFTFGLVERNNHYYLDLVGINKKQLLDLGVKKTNIFDTKICTSCQNQEFFSYRKEGNSCGRMMSVIMLP